MGLLDALAGGLEAASGGMAKIGFEQIESDIAEQRQLRVEQARETLRQGGVKADFEFSVDPENVRRKADAEATVAKSKTQADIDVKVENAAKLGEAEAKAKVAELTAMATPEALGAARKIADAQRDPSQQRLLNLQIQEATVKLGEAKAKAGENSKIRGLIDAQANVDMSQPGADRAKAFYADKATEAIANRSRAEATGKGTLKIMKDENDQDVALLQDADGNIYKVDPANVSPYKAVTPPTVAIDALKKNPKLADQFDAKYGAGAASKYLKGN